MTWPNGVVVQKSSIRKLSSVSRSKLGKLERATISKRKTRSRWNLHRSLFLRGLLLDGDKTLKVLAILGLDFCDVTWKPRKAVFGRLWLTVLLQGHTQNSPAELWGSQANFITEHWPLLFSDFCRNCIETLNSRNLLKKKKMKEKKIKEKKRNNLTEIPV